MKQIGPVAAMALVFSLAACGEPMDGSDTADLGNDVTEVQTGPTDAPAYQPGEDGPLQSDVEPTTEPTLSDDVTVTDPAQSEDAAM